MCFFLWFYLIVIEFVVYAESIGAVGIAQFPRDAEGVHPFVQTIFGAEAL